MQRFVPMGIIQYMLEFHTWMKFKTDINKPSSEPAVLSMDDVAFGFYICMGACGLSIAAFVIEKIIFEFKKRMEKLFEDFIMNIFKRNTR